jgi:dihydrofolate reductase
VRKVIEYSLISADGVFDDPNPLEMGVLDYQDDAYLHDSLGLFSTCEAILFGRSTYEIFARIYGGGGGNPAYAARFNAIRKYVFSSKLERADWNNSTIVRGDAVSAVANLKRQEGGDLLILGHGRLSEALLKHRLLDTFNLAILPVVVGHGKLFLREGQAARLTLTAAKVFSKIVKLTYEPQY